MPPKSHKPGPEDGQLEIDLGLTPEPDVQFKTLEGIDTDSVSIEELARLVADTRRHNTALQAQLSSGTPEEENEVKKHPHAGGAFGGALKRRIEQSDSESLRAATNDHDLKLLAPTSLHAELFPATRGDLVYAGVLFAPAEYGAITVSPSEVNRRIGANVMAHTTDRPPTERVQRRLEVVTNDLQRRGLKADLLISDLETERIAVARLRKEMRSPGYSHMSQDDVDSLMSATEGVILKMFDAIIANHKLPTERTTDLVNAMHYLISADDYKATFKYWRLVSNLAEVWIQNKKDRLTRVRYNVAQELNQVS